MKCGKDGCEKEATHFREKLETGKFTFPLCTLHAGTDKSWGVIVKPIRKERTGDTDNE